MGADPEVSRAPRCDLDHPQGRYGGFPSENGKDQCANVTTNRPEHGSTPPVTAHPTPPAEDPPPAADQSRAQDPALADDPVLARRAALGDRGAFADIVHRHGPGMFHYATTMLGGNTHDAEDAVQDALTKAWQHLPQLRAEASLRTWMYRITANEVRAARQRRRPVPVDDQLLAPLPAAAQDQPAQRLDQEQLRRALSVALAELPWRQRAAWILAEEEGMTYQQIANALETNVTVVRGQLHRARRTLSIRMAQWK